MSNNSCSSVFGIYLLFATTCLGCNQYEANQIAIQSASPQDSPQELSDEVKALLDQLKSRAVVDRVTAALKLTEHSSELATFILPLGEHLTDHSSEVKQAVTFAFQEFGDAAIEHIRRLIASTDKESFFLGCEMIRALGPIAEPLLPAVAEYLSSSDANRRKGAIYALMPMKELAAPYVDKIGPLLKDQPDFNTTLFACRTIIGIGTKANSLAGALRTLAENGNVSERSYAYWALGAIGPVEDFDSAEFLIPKLDEYLQVERQRALRGIALLGPHATAAVEKVRSLMDNEVKNVEPEAAFALWKITGEVQPSLDRLIELYEHPIHQLPALSYIEEMGEAARPAEAFLLGLLEVPDESIREHAINCLVSLGTVSNQAIEAMQTMTMADPDLLLRFSAKRALRKLGHHE
ncbi:MAG TPA: hypothetical protein PKD64_11735 [Pirellulaceae bacterium]|nr:hypothetical protein [Pirellulaceae bacterium]HMO92855.1 hypothetical protein [Pirellulaceae bacterium]HMP69403.1 hypothetical protein [Pirellulaceae bacterium]